MTTFYVGQKITFRSDIPDHHFGFKRKHANDILTVKAVFDVPSTNYGWVGHHQWIKFADDFLWSGAWFIPVDDGCFNLGVADQ
jgi:hypothetical protein